MANRDIVSNIVAISVLSAAIAAEGSTNGLSVDTADFGEGVGFFLNVTGTGAFDVSLEESDDDITFTPVAAEKLIGAASQVDTLAAGSPMPKVGVFSSKRYVRPVLAAVGEVVSADVTIDAVLAGEYLPT